MDALVAAAPDAIITADSEGRILTWNAAAEHIFGHPASEVVGQSLTLIVPERFRSAHEAGIARVSTGGERHVIGSTVELEGVRRGGLEFPIELSLSTWTEDGEVRFGGIVRDITERVRLTRELAESEARVSAILGSANDAIVGADQFGIITLWNDAAERMLGHSADDAVGQPLTIIIPERFHDAHNAGILRMTRGEEPRIIGQTVEVFAVHKDGDEIPV
jgi:PAS domain S-box-containing protein